MKKEEKNKKEQPKTETRGSIFVMIINMFMGFISFGTAVYCFKDKFYLFGFLYIIVGIFSYIPKKIIKISHGNRLLIIIFTSIILFVLSIIFLGPITEDYIYHDMQEEFVVGLGLSNISLNIYNITESTSINGETTKGYFLTINCKITNLANGTIMIKDNFGHYLKDNQNNTFEGKFNAIGIPLEPHLEKECYLLFEIPKTAQGLRLYLEGYPDTYVIDLKR